ncbi:MAG: hypothetical protein A2Y92_05195 [Chloroflexi bacterium RBG_13_57_8]|nr:MAG: hypothetical protein A2Y92_05195 [Chloroflexi bacterium RBG_13_57_8]
MDRLENGAKKLGIFLNQKNLEKFEVYYRELVDWNKRINLTRITDYDDVQVKHFLDSLTVLAAIDPDGLKVIDVGTGAGLPGIPLKIACPGLNLTLLEATAKKTRFLEQLAIKLELANVAIETGRAEEIAHDGAYREKFDITLSRAVAALPALAELTLAFCKVGGCCVVQKKGDIGSEVEHSHNAIGKMGGRLREVKAVKLEEFAGERYLVIIDKVQATPPQYPRRPGLPVKRPLLS